MNTRTPETSSQRTKKKLTAEKLRKLSQFLSQDTQRAKMNLNGSSRNASDNGDDSKPINVLSLSLELFSKASLELLENRSLEDLALIGERAFMALREMVNKPQAVIVHTSQSETSLSLSIALEDRPFIVNTISEAIREFGLDIQVLLHPILNFHSRKISLSYVEINFAATLPQGKDLEQKLVSEITSALQDLLLITDDFTAMMMATDSVALALEATSSACPIASADRREISEFLRWLIDGALVFCGHAIWNLDRQGNISNSPSSSLGLLKSKQKYAATLLQELKTEAEHLALRPEAIRVVRTLSKSPVHRRTRFLSVHVIEYAHDGKAKSVHSLVGLTTSKARAQESSTAPLIRRKLQRLFELEATPVNSYDYKSIVNLVNNMPIDDALRLDIEDLRDVVRKIINSYSRATTHISAFIEANQRAISVFANLPRERFNSSLRTLLQRLIEQAYGATPGSSECTLDVTDKFFVRFYFSILLAEPLKHEIDLDALEREVAEISRTWKDNFEERIFANKSIKNPKALVFKYADAFPEDYRASLSAAEAEQDVLAIEALSAEAPYKITLIPHVMLPNGNASAVDSSLSTLILYHLGSQVTISQALPIFENTGLDVISEETAPCEPKNAPSVYIHRFLVRSLRGATLDTESFNLHTALGLQEVFRNNAANDPLNSLLLNSKLDIRSISLLRAYSSLLSQLNKFATRHAIFHALAAGPLMASQLWEMFDVRFNPKIKLALGARQKRFEEINRQFQDALRLVSDIAQDRILRGLGSLIEHSVRTNFYLNQNAIAIKIHSEKAELIPQPRPLYEIFVSSPLVEGVHLRGSRVARGGLRWSDRKDDYRTEVLGLMKTQKIKNTVIVPGGAKGGFIVRNTPEDVSQLKATVEAAYTEFIRSLLSVTDNRVEGKVQHPAGLIIHDGPDPYFVVAADKGTATFSDIANRIAVQEYNFWLGDAFASGGSNGYDHKLYGITAKGAWECVKRHFNALGIDFKNTPFTVIGIGDMAGDVFGNGLILCDQMKLIAAFNHKHIFIDPSPDPKKSFTERLRLFQTPGSQWSDYTPALISKGGGVFQRSAKEISLSADARKALGISSDTPTMLSPEQIMSFILKAPADLLWNGGIGTYVKSEQESNPDVNDASNDRVRVNANELRVRVIGEGGNLGFTQRGRIEFAKRGGKIFTDAIDNSGGVDLSDHEVNIKILFSGIMADKGMSVAERNKILKSMAEEVCSDVLADNRGHAIALTLSERRSARNIEYHRSLIREVTSRGYLSRSLEALPDDEDLNERAKNKVGLYSPELAVSLAGLKMWLKESFVASELPSSPLLSSFVLEYFPTVLRKKYEKEILQHALAPNIIATRALNRMVNAAGITFVHRMSINHSVEVLSVIKSYLAAELILDYPALRAQLDQFDNHKDNDLFLTLLEELSRALRATTSWLIGNQLFELPLEEMVSRYKPSFDTLVKHAEQYLVGAERELVEERTKKYSTFGLDKKTSNSLVLFPLIIPILEMLWTARESGAEIKVVTQVFSSVLSTLGVNKLVTMGSPYDTSNRWEKELRIHSFGEIRRSLTALATQLLKKKITDREKVAQALKDSPSFNAFSATLTEFSEQPSSAAGLAVIGKQIRRYQLS